MHSQILILKVDDKKTRKFVYPEHLPLTKIQAGLKSGKYLQVCIVARILQSALQKLISTVYISSETVWTVMLAI